MREVRGMAGLVVTDRRDCGVTMVSNRFIEGVSAAPAADLRGKRGIGFPHGRWAEQYGKGCASGTEILGKDEAPEVGVRNR